jgi:hypothetical protein
MSQSQHDIETITWMPPRFLYLLCALLGHTPPGRESSVVQPLSKPDYRLLIGTSSLIRPQDAIKVVNVVLVDIVAWMQINLSGQSCHSFCLSNPL